MQVGGGDKVRPALSLVGYEEDLRPAMAFVFGSTFVCDTLKIAKQVLSPRSSPFAPLLAWYLHMMLHVHIIETFIDAPDFFVLTGDL